MDLFISIFPKQCTSTTVLMNQKDRSLWGMILAESNSHLQKQRVILGKREISVPKVVNPTEKQNPNSSRSVSVDLLATLSEALLSDSVSPQSQPVLFPEIPTQVIVSFPIHHSWKPPLQRLLHQSLSTILRAVGETHQSPQTFSSSELPDHCDLELFARELRSGCTSLGNEVIFHQTVSISLSLLLSQLARQSTDNSFKDQ
jgi:hypothetical protein